MHVGTEKNLGRYMKALILLGAFGLLYIQDIQDLVTECYGIRGLTGTVDV